MSVDAGLLCNIVSLRLAGCGLRIDNVYNECLTNMQRLHIAHAGDFAWYMPYIPITIKSLTVMDYQLIELWFHQPDNINNNKIYKLQCLDVTLTDINEEFHVVTPFVASVAATLTHLTLRMDEHLKTFGLHVLRSNYGKLTKLERFTIIFEEESYWSNREESYALMHTLMTTLAVPDLIAHKYVLDLTNLCRCAHNNVSEDNFLTIIGKVCRIWNLFDSDSNDKKQWFELYDHIGRLVDGE